VSPQPNAVAEGEAAAAADGAAAGEAPSGLAFEALTVFESRCVMSEIHIVNEYPRAGVKFRFVATPQPWWRGVVECEVLDVRAPTLLRYTWVGDEGDAPTLVTYQLEPHQGSTRFTFEHTGFTGIGGYIVSRALRRVRRRMLGVGLPAVLDQLDDDGEPGAPVRPCP
jgi:uncharacterized protein YndB with AHSA1/START domain